MTPNGKGEHLHIFDHVPLGVLVNKEEVAVGANITLKLGKNIEALNTYHGLDTAQGKAYEHLKGICTKCYQRLMLCKCASNSTKRDSKTASDHAAADIERTKVCMGQFQPRSVCRPMYCMWPLWHAMQMTPSKEAGQTDVMLYCAWCSFLEMGQAHYK